MLLKSRINTLALALACLSSTYAVAQSSIIESKVTNQLSIEKAVNLHLFEIDFTADTHQFDTLISNVTYLKINKKAVEELLQYKYPLIEFDIPTPTGKRTFQLQKYDIYTDDFMAYEKRDGVLIPVNYEKGTFYRGIVKGIAPSFAAFSLFSSEFSGIFSTNENGNYNLIPNYVNPGDNNDNFIIFNDLDVLNREKHLAPCGVTEAMSGKPNNEPKYQTEGVNTDGNCRTVTVAMHCDYLLYQRNNNSMTSSQNYLTALMNGNAAVFENEDIKMSLKSIVVQTTPNTYTIRTSTDVLNAFGNEIGTNVTADLMQMITGYTENNFASLGGLAWLDVLCQTPTRLQNTFFGPFSMVNNEGVINQVRAFPVYSWDVNASAHEIGHNLGSHHTHWCGWAGGAIDGCMTLEPDNNNNGCANPNPMFPGNGGTMMSYCHLQTVGVNFNNGFGPQPGNLIRANVSNATCVTSLAPSRTITAASTTLFANKMCEDGSYYLLYNDNNTATETDDILILGLHKDSIGQLNLAQARISMTTRTGYGSNRAYNPIEFYKPTPNWHETHRSWYVELPTNTAGKAQKVLFPVTNTDLNDMRSAFPGVATTNLKAYVFNNQTAADSQSMSMPNNIELLEHNDDLILNSWKYVTQPGKSYNFVEIHTNAGVFAGGLGYGFMPNSIGNIIKNQLKVFPNPTNKELNIDLRSIDGQTTIEVLDYLGRVVHQAQTKHAAMLTIDVAHLSNSTYIIRCVNNDNVYINKFTKQ